MAPEHEAPNTKPDKRKEPKWQPPIRQPRGSISNSIITRRNGGVPHRFLDDIGGCSANYR